MRHGIIILLIFYLGQKREIPPRNKLLIPMI